MLAARWWGRHDVRVEDIADPGEPAEGWLRLQVVACGICGTDVEEYTSGPNVIPTEPHPLSGRSAPLVLGHEAVGIIEAVGPGVELEPGTPVAVEANVWCGTCWWCQRHQHQLCVQLASLGLMGDGGLAEVMLAPAYMCIPYSDKLGAEAAVLAEPLSVAVRAVERGGVQLGSTVGIFGTGTIGLLTIQTARRAGARSIIAVDRHEQRRKLALQLGADVAVTPEEATEAGMDLTGGLGLDITIEAAGNAGAGAAAVGLARRGGRTVMLGVYGGMVSFDMMDFLLGEKEVVACLSHVYDTDFATAVSLLDRGLIDTAPLVTDRVPLENVVRDGFDALVAAPEEHLKIVVTPNGHLTPAGVP